MHIEGVVLAAGYSRRADAFKMALTIDGRSILERCIDGLIDHCSRIIVVGGYRIEQIEEMIRPYTKVQLIFNERFAEGMFSSVKAGVSQVRGERFFLTPGDYPLISAAVCQRLLNVNDEIVIPTFAGKKGHPILMTGRLAQEILEESDASNLRSFILRHGYRAAEVDEEGILFDIDTQEDYRQALSMWQGGRVKC